VTRRLQAFARPRGESRVPTRLSELVDETLRLVGRGLEAEGCRLETAHEEGVTASVNETQLLQVVLNLVTNARHAMAGSTHRRLTVTTRREGGSAVVSVGDSGPGIPADVLPRIFDPFFSTKGVYGEGRVSGMGLGLSMARSIVEDHGGTLAVRSPAGKGDVRNPIARPRAGRFRTVAPARRRRTRGRGEVLVGADRRRRCRGA
jgi:two-component system C4-dicarboxylate transport sensor histidine kinase DctB